MTDWTRVAGVVALGLWLNAPDPARAQSLIQRPIRMIVPSTAGSPNDIMARLIAEQLSSSLASP